MKSIKPSIIAEDNSFYLVNKPAGWLSIPDRYDNNRKNIKQYLSQKDDVFTVHRIDKDTSGLILFAKNPDAHRDLALQFENHQVYKRYEAVVHGIIVKDALEIVSNIAPSKEKKGKMTIVNRGGKHSVSNLNVLKRYENYTHVEVFIKTGRTHQIRVQLANIGHPLLVDPLYGNSSNFFLSSIKKKKFRTNKANLERPLLSRTPLHSKELRFNHPSSGERQIFEIPLPKDMQATLNQFDKWLN